MEEYGEGAAIPNKNNDSAMVRCDVTGNMIPVADAVEFMGNTVSAEGKEILLRELRDPDDAPVATELVRPSFGSRFKGYTIDVGLFIAFYIICSYCFDLIVPDKYFRPDFILLILFTRAADFFYIAGMHAKYGKTLGKMACGFHVVNMDGSAIGVRIAFIRAIWSNGLPSFLSVVAMGPLASALPGSTMAYLTSINWYSLINYLFLIADRKSNRALHDRIAETRVVMDTHSAPRMPTGGYGDG